jgi:hypothetical protein
LFPVISIDGDRVSLFVWIEIERGRAPERESQEEIAFFHAVSRWLRGNREVAMT